jgi:hypothetical protein
MARPAHNLAQGFESNEKARFGGLFCLPEDECGTDNNRMLY